MPSTLVHVALGGLVAAVLLAPVCVPVPGRPGGRRATLRVLRPVYTRRGALVVLAFAALPDLDALLAVVVPATHRAALHTLLLPVGLGVAVWWDARREGSWLRARWGGRGVRTAWAALAALCLAGIAPDLVTNGVNLFYPLHDRFYTLNGDLSVSTTRGLVQTFVTPAATGGTTANTFYYTGVDVARGADPARAARVFRVVDSGTQALLVAVGALALWWRDAETRRS